LLDILVRIPFVDIRPDMPKSSRREEVLIWLERYPKVDRYVVVNDEDDELDDLPPFQPSGRTAPTRKLSVGVKRYLSGRSNHTMRAIILRACRRHSLSTGCAAASPQFLFRVRESLLADVRA
jgi:hypothetical protein